MIELPMFPLGSVLFPGMPVHLRVFEERYLMLLRDVVPADRRFGIVLIERGFEVGGGDHRFGVGTTCSIAGLEPGAGWLDLVGRGGDRFEVLEWLPEQPYPRARVRVLPALAWAGGDDDRLARAERVVRIALRRAAQLEDLPWDPEIRLPGERAEYAWRLAGIAPIGALDQQSLLGATSASELLERLICVTEDAARAREFGWGRPTDPPTADEPR